MTESYPFVFELNGVSREFRGGQSLRQWLTQEMTIVHAVRDVSLSVKKGEVLGIIGESGSGKSTLGYLLANLETASSGDILFHGQPIVGMDPAQKRRFRKKVQVIFQDSTSALNPRRRVWTNIGDALRLTGLPKKRRSEKIAFIADMVGLSRDQLQSYPHELSGGQRQRVGIARALAMEPEVIIADEPVSALDVSLQGQIINLLMELRRRLGLTIVLISHDVAVVRNISDRVAVMFGGRLVECGDSDEIISHSMHPYTDELIASIPKGVPGVGSRWVSVSTSSDDRTRPMSEGCPYSNRCSRVTPRCRSEVPDREEVSESHWVACHLYGAESAVHTPLLKHEPQ